MMKKQWIRDVLIALAGAAVIGFVWLSWQGYGQFRAGQAAHARAEASFSFLSSQVGGTAEKPITRADVLDAMIREYAASHQGSPAPTVPAPELPKVKK